MRPPSIQIQSVLDTFGRQGWQCELVEGRDVLRTGFEAHHTRIHLHAQAFPELNALSVVTETPMEIDEDRLGMLLELLARANKQLTLGSAEYDIDRSQLMFRLTNLFEREKYDPDIVSSMVHCAIAELDRLTPYAAIIRDTPADLLEDLSIERLLMREDLIPPVPGEEEDEF
jgi:hypothetical protein